MNSLEQQIKQTLQPNMYVPDALSSLFEWIENNGLYIDVNNDRRIGFLYPEEKLKAQWTENSRYGGTNIEFFAEGNVNMRYWLGHEREDVLNRLCVFAKTGAEGSMAAFWIDDDGNQKIVHLGSGSGSTLICVLAHNPVDFLRLLAIGYDEICWHDTFDARPNDSADDIEFFVHPNTEFQNWVTSTFNVDIPATASAIIPYPCEMGDESPNDEFCQWVESVTT